MIPFDPAKAFQQLRAESQREKQVALETWRRKQEGWAVYRRRLAIS